MSNLSYIELQMNMANAAECDDVYLEGFNIFEFYEKIAKTLDTIITNMKAFVKKLSIDIAGIKRGRQIKKHVAALKIDAENGMEIKLPNFKAVSKVYMTSCKVLPRELNKIERMYRRAKSAKDFSRISEKIKKMDKDTDYLGEQIDEILANKISLRGPAAVAAIDQLLTYGDDSIRMYNHVLTEFEKFQVECQRLVRTAYNKASISPKVDLNGYTRLLTKVSVTLSGKMKKIYFGVLQAIA